MKKIKSNWKVITIVSSVVATIVGLVMIFWDKIEDIYYNIRNK